MRWLLGVMLLTGACNNNSTTESCGELVTCPSGAYQFCAAGGGGRYVLSDGTQLKCSTASACQALTPTVSVWCGGAAPPDLGPNGTVVSDLGPGSMPLPKTGLPYTGPQIDPQLNDATTCPDATLEPNDDLTSAVQYDPPLDAASIKIVKLAICPRGATPFTGRPDVDFYRSTLGGAALLTLKAEIFYDITYGDLDVGILDANGRLVASDGTAHSNGCTTATILPGQPYYVVVQGANGAVNRYDARISATSTPSACP